MSTSDSDRLQERLAKLSPEKRAELVKLLRRSSREGGPAAAEPSVTADRASRHEPFALTPLQHAYWLGRSGIFELGDVSTHSYCEIDIDGGDVERLQRCLRRLVERHDMLRAVLDDDGTQRVLESVAPYVIAVHEGERAAADLRDRMSHQVTGASVWPLFEVASVRLGGGKLRVHVSMDALIFDGWSIALFLTQWGDLYHGRIDDVPEPRITFRDCARFEEERRLGPEYARAREYWAARLADMPPAPVLPLACEPGSLERTRFRRLSLGIDGAAWSRLEERVEGERISRTAVLITAYADVLGLWGESRRFTLNVPRFNRPPVHADIDRLIGEFASSTILVVDGTAETFRERARALQEQLWRDLDNTEFSGVEVLRELAQSRGAASALIPVVFTASAQDADGNDAYVTTAARRLGEPAFVINQTSQVRLDNHVAVHDGELIVDWDFVEGLHPPGMNEAMADAYVRHLRALVAAESWDEPWRDTAWRLMPEDQRTQRAELNGLTRPIADEPVHARFLEHARTAPEALAVAGAESRLDYGELERLSASWAARLVAGCGAAPRPVAVVMEKCVEQIVAAVAIARAGMSCLPVDPLVPNERLAFLLENGDVACVLVHEATRGRFNWPDGVRVLDLGDDPGTSTVEEAAVPSDALAALIYTSGSTGDPKGVMVTHRNLVSVMEQTNATWGVGPTDRAIGLTALHHDLSLYDVWGMLSAGAAVIVPDAEDRRDPGHWIDVLHSENVTVWNTVPAMMEMLLERCEDAGERLPDSLRLVILGGDWVPVSIPRRLRALRPDVRLVTIGGPTETTIWNVWNPVGDVDESARSIPYGKPIANNAYYCCDAELVERPTWVPGELCCSGAGVTAGYWRDDDRTRAKYVTHPRTGERVYRTGDRGRFLPDGFIEFLGRTDLQVKINGQRIELGEVEAALRRHESVRSAAVRVVDDGRGNRRLAGYVVPEGAGLVEAEVLEHIARTLPPHMTPASLAVLESLPLNANGKVDREALPQPATAAATPAVVDEAPRASEAVVRRIADVVAGVLKISDPDPDADLVNLGASSLDMVRIGNRLEREFGRRPRVDQLFRMRSIRALATLFDDGVPQGAADGSPAPPSSSSAADAIVASFDLLTDEAEKEAFKKAEPGLRHGDDALPFITLDTSVNDPEVWMRRRSRRRYLEEPIPFAAFSRLLESVRRVDVGGAPKYAYASPGGLYPIQVYLHVKEGRIEGVPAGTWYHRPTDHRLVQLVEDAPIGADIHVPFINSPVFDACGFSVFLVSQLAAIAPVYGDYALHFSTLSAGIITHHLEMTAPDCGIGLCQMGSIEFERVRHLFGLDDSHLLIHSLVGGLIDPDEPTPWDGEDEACDEEGVI